MNTVPPAPTAEARKGAQEVYDAIHATCTELAQQQIAAIAKLTQERDELLAHIKNQANLGTFCGRLGASCPHVTGIKP